MIMWSKLNINLLN